MKPILFILSFFLVSAFIHPAQIYAAPPGPGEFGCEWSNPGGPFGDPSSCRLPAAGSSNNGCQFDINQVPNLPLDCSQYDKANDCEATTFTCQEVINANVDYFAAAGLAGQPQGAGITSPTYCAGRTGIETALGCLSFYPEAFLRQIIPWSIGIAGMVAFFLILFAAFQHITAAGNPDQLKASQDMLASALAGLVIIILATVLLRIIGVDILGLEPFGF